MRHRSEACDDKRQSYKCEAAHNGRVRQYDGDDLYCFDGDVTELGDEDVREDEAAENIEVHHFQTRDAEIGIHMAGFGDVVLSWTEVGVDVVLS